MKLRSLFFGFSGRIARQSFALATLFNFLIGLIVVYQTVLADEAGDRALLTFWGFMIMAVTVAVFWSTLALAVKRLNDIGLTPFLAALYFFPVVNWLLLFFLALKPGEPRTNRHGPPPFGESEEDARDIRHP